MPPDSWCGRFPPNPVQVHRVQQFLGPLAALGLAEAAGAQRQFDVARPR